MPWKFEETSFLVFIYIKSFDTQVKGYLGKEVSF